ncbi:MAG TPA: hypothetical protein VG891_02780 [Rhizomicrobium sp.]|nr:hypothetical protein [Rhizomicrobium sp.]
MSVPPQNDAGYFHLTEKGWIRHDNLPYPADRIETWRYEGARPAQYAKEQIRLTRIWCDPHKTEAQRGLIRAQFGNAVAPSEDRHLILDCLV